ncbi:Fe-S cluster assembly protein SufB [bacterium]|nr:Fe-S cluster assembly protein SufB [bacterium]
MPPDNETGALSKDFSEFDDYEFGHFDHVKPLATTGIGLSEDVVRQISALKEEPDWMLEIRLKAYEAFVKMPMPTWGPDLSEINFEDYTYFIRSTEGESDDWEDMPEEILATFDKLGIPQAEQKFLAGATAQYESEAVYHKLREDLEEQGVIFLTMDAAVKECPELLREYWGSVIPATDNKFSALNTAVWSGGSFIYIPPGVSVETPLQTYFRINEKSFGQFERTLIIADKGAKVVYNEGCSAPKWAASSLHAAVVELIALEGARIDYQTIQNWYKNIYNLVTKRAKAMKDATVTWLDINVGSRITIKYPGVMLMGEGARGEVQSIAFANDEQTQDSGAKMIHLAPRTTSIVTSKSISKGTGRSSYRGMIKMAKNAVGASARVECDALLLDESSRTDTYPVMDSATDSASIAHEASVSKVSEDQIFYLQSRGISEIEAMKMIVNGFLEPLVKRLPLEYSVEFQRLVELELEGSVG